MGDNRWQRVVTGNNRWRGVQRAKFGGEGVHFLRENFALTLLEMRGTRVLKLIEIGLKLWPSIANTCTRTHTRTHCLIYIYRWILVSSPLVISPILAVWIPGDQSVLTQFPFNSSVRRWQTNNSPSHFEFPLVSPKLQFSSLREMSHLPRLVLTKNERNI